MTESGNLLETFVVGELRKQVSWLDEPVTLGHWRTNAGPKARDDEVDLVVEYDGGKVLAFEAKANQRVAGSELQGCASSGTPWSIGQAVSESRE